VEGARPLQPARDIKGKPSDLLVFLKPGDGELISISQPLKIRLIFLTDPLRLTDA
jgi:hypothetical protein